MNKLPHDRVSWFFIGVIFLFWFAVAWKYTRGLIIPSIGDFQRDTAITFNILSGNIFGDAAYLGERAWYPFLSHLLFVFFNKITGIPILKLYAGYPFILSVPAILLFLLAVRKIFKNTLFTLLAFFTFLFVMPWTSYNLHVFAHPLTLALGVMSLAVFLFWHASSSIKIFDWIMAGVGIALVIYTQPFAAITVASGIVFYQLSTRRYWRNFIIMVVTAFIIASPYIFPLITVYQLHSRNTLQPQLLTYAITLDNVFFGYGNIRWINCFFILTGILFAFFRKNRFDRLILPMFFLGSISLLLGLDRIYGEQYGFPVIRLPEAFALQDLWINSHFSAVFLFSMGVWYWLTHLPKLFRLSLANSRFVVLILFISIYGFFMLPLFIQRASDWSALAATKNQFSADWMVFIDWVNKNTSINDVFIGLSDPTSYVFVSGMTGRKVVATNNDHVNPFVDQPKRIYDLSSMYMTTSMDDFKRLAKEYKISYVVVSPYEIGANLDKFSQNSFFESVFSQGEIKVYKLNW